MQAVNKHEGEVFRVSERNMNRHHFHGGQGGQTVQRHIRFGRKEMFCFPLTTFIFPVK